MKDWRDCAACAGTGEYRYELDAPRLSNFRTVVYVQKCFGCDGLGIIRKPKEPS